MYYAELLALTYSEIENILNTNGRDKIFQIFFLESTFAEYIYTSFLNSKIEKILPKVYHRLITIQELIYYDELLRFNQRPSLVQ